MILINIDSILDSHWLSTILETVYAIFLFLLGIPLLITHVFMPEEIRELYNRRIGKSHKKQIAVFSVWVIVFTLFSANHFWKNWVTLYINDHKISERILTVFFLITIFLFVLYCKKVYTYFMKTFSDGKGFWSLLLEDIEADIVKSREQGTPFKSSIIEDLKLICGASKTPDARQKFLSSMKSITSAYLSYPNYKGMETSPFFKEVNSEGISENQSFQNIVDLKKIAEMAHNIISAYNKNRNNLMKVDSREAMNCLFYIATIAMQKGKRELFGYCLHAIYESPNSYDKVRDLCRLAFNDGHRRHVAVKAKKYLTLYLNPMSSPKEKKACLRNTLVFFSWLYCDDNWQSKRFVNERLRPHIFTNEISEEDFNRIKEIQYSSADFFSANCVDKLMDAYFPWYYSQK